MLRLLSFRGEISARAFPPVAAALLLSQHAAVAAIYRAHDAALRTDWGFWMLPLRRVAMLRDVTAAEAALGFAFSLLVTWAIALVCFRRAARSRRGYFLAVLAIVPGLQMLAVPLLAAVPVRREETEETEPSAERGRNGRHVLQGVLAGAAIIVFAVLVSAVTFGAYGWGLFVLTPFVVGVTTAYVVNRRFDAGLAETMSLVAGAATLGSVALVLLALEGLACLILAAPLGTIAGMMGAFLGYAAAIPGHRRGRPYLSVAILPAVFAFEAAMPPAVAFSTGQTIAIAAPPSAVWAAVTSDAAVALPPGLVGQAGLAYPLGAVSALRALAANGSATSRPARRGNASPGGRLRGCLHSGSSISRPRWRR